MLWSIFLTLITFYAKGNAKNLHKNLKFSLNIIPVKSVRHFNAKVFIVGRGGGISHPPVGNLTPQWEILPPWVVGNPTPQWEIPPPSGNSYPPRWSEIPPP